MSSGDTFPNLKSRYISYPSSSCRAIICFWFIKLPVEIIDKRERSSPSRCFQTARSRFAFTTSRRSTSISSTACLYHSSVQQQRAAAPTKHGGIASSHDRGNFHSCVHVHIGESRKGGDGMRRGEAGTIGASTLKPAPYPSSCTLSALLLGPRMTSAAVYAELLCQGKPYTTKRCFLAAKQVRV